jgi:hypothetical protein
MRIRNKNNETVHKVAEVTRNNKSKKVLEDAGYRW